MKPDELEPLSPDLRSLLDAERPLEVVPAATREKLYGKLTTTLGAAAVGGGTGAAVGKAIASGKAGLATKIVIATVAFGVGGGAGALVHARLAPSLPPPAPIVIRVEAPPPLPPPPAAEAAPPKPPPPRPAKPAPPVKSGELGAERSLVEQARAALARQDPAAALFVLAQHEREHANGQLAEERTALQIIALAQNGQPDEARALATRFKAKWPGSLLMPAVDGASR